MDIRTKPTIFKLKKNQSVKDQFDELQVIEGDVFQYHGSTHPDFIRKELKDSKYVIKYISNGEERDRLRHKKEVTDVTFLIRVVKVDDRYNELLNRVKGAETYLKNKFKEARYRDDYQTMAKTDASLEMIRNLIL